MSWYSKVAWTEGLFLRQHHLQQHDRYLEKLIECRVRHLSPYPWGFSELEIDNDLAQQSKFALRRACGIMPDGTPFDMPGVSPLPDPVEVRPEAGNLFAWLSLPAALVNGRELDMAEAGSASRYTRELERIVDSAAAMQLEEEIEVAHPRLAFDIRETPRPGFHALKIARIVEVRDRTVVYDQGFAPPVLSLGAHRVVAGFAERVIGWIDNHLSTLARHAADPSASGGLQNIDYFRLQMLNRVIGGLKHLTASRYTHPVELYREVLAIAGELSTYSPERLARTYRPYDQDDLKASFEPVLDDIQRLLNLDIGRPVRLELVERDKNQFLAPITNRNLFRDAAFVLEVSAARPLVTIRDKFPDLCKIGPNSRMKEIVQMHLPGIQLVHTPTPPRQIRTYSDRVYFYLDKESRLWPEFSVASGIGIQISADWPELHMELWAIQEGYR
ncbi:type VI secretion system baseplate subunit TssK [Aurantimonas sp. 22II-16-19i]|uniref:type VI secretion system baseplate subunit TssK n=1 Tax=Aurantimonas sp. 22II-16-19i TaxID=1317114 RepID=UPI0009F7FA20|nr:type VI secretion system baseplate subunit TssK [Aurantimonas sp. 22II-16-19i]ORE97229.1 type VI secretion protein [Aurantimonas sp. 22II-16-19i]